MNNQNPKMRLIAMFYLLVFSSALLLSGVFDSQRSAFPVSKEKKDALVFASSPDSIPVSGVNASAETNPSASEITDQDDKSATDLAPYIFSFTFTPVIQWFFGLTSKKLSLRAEPATATHSNIWLSIRNLRI